MEVRTMKCPRCNRLLRTDGVFIEYHQPATDSPFSEVDGAVCKMSASLHPDKLGSLARLGMPDGPGGRKQKIIRQEEEVS